MIAGVAPAVANERYAAIVIDAASGEVFHESSADKRLHPASLTKLMTLYLAFKAIDQGQLNLNQKITISRRAAGQAPSKLGLPAGASLRTEDAIYALVTKSANDIATALAEAIGGTESEFARLMTEEARRLGMSHTTFRNASGLPNNEQISSARDMARLAQAIMRDYPERYHYFNTHSWNYRGSAYRNHNRLLGVYPGMDGLKTGFIRASGFNLVASAVRGNLRLIAVVFGGTTADRRNARVAKLLDEGFASARGAYLVANGTGDFMPFDAPLPVHKPGITGPVLVAEAEASPFAEAIARTAARAAAVNPMPPALAGYPQPRTPPSAIRSDQQDLSLAALDTEIVSISQGVGGDIVADLPDIPTWGVQVGAFGDSTSGNRALAIATSLAPEQLTRAHPEILEVHTSRGRLFRARLMGLDEQTAALACSRLIEAGNACLTIAPAQNNL